MKLEDHEYRELRRLRIQNRLLRYAAPLPAALSFINLLLMAAWLYLMLYGWQRLKQ